MLFKTPASVYTRRRNSKSVSSAAILALAVLAAAALVVGAQHPSVTLADGGGGNGLASLKTVAIPRPANLARFIKDEQAAIALGKALFWDQQVGSDGQSCASCHFHAGADSRSKNQIDPGLRDVPTDATFQLDGLNFQLKASDFPLHKLANPNDRNSAVLFDTNDIVSSQGVRNITFTNVIVGNTTDAGISIPDPIFSVDGVNVRRVEPRNTPTMINAVFNFRNFWDGRARNEFNGVNPIGDLDPFARVLISPVPGTMRKTALNGDLRLESSSLASQAVAPPLSDLEMSFNGRTFAKLGKKMLSFQHALPNQQVAPDDSVFFQQPSLNLMGQTVFLGPFPSRFPDKGIEPSYQDLIRRAFQPRWWSDPQVITFGACAGLVGTTSPSAGGNDPTLCFQPPSATPLTTDQFTQMEYNFSLFFGIGVQMYEATLRADDTPFDRCFDQGGAPVTIDPTQPPVPDCYALTTQQKLGLQLFQDKGKCIACHGGPELTNASVQNVRNEKLERMIMGDNNVAVYDNGFYNTAVRRCVALAGPCDDVGIGATIGPLNLPLSMSRFFQLPQNCGFVDGVGCTNAPPIPPRPAEGLANNQALQPNERVAVDGAFKTPGIRNVELP